MMRFAPYILKSLWRRRSRTVLTVTGGAVALLVFCLVGAIQEGVRDLERRERSQRRLVVFQANKFCPATSHLPQDYAETIASVDGVRRVAPIQVFTNNCRASLDVVVFYGMPPAQLRELRPLTLLAGDWDSFHGRQDAALVGRSVARRRGVGVGDKFAIGPLVVTVAGVFASDDRAEENYVYSHLEFLQRRGHRNLVGTVTQFEVVLAAAAAPQTVCADIDRALATGPVGTTTRPLGAFRTKSLDDVIELIGLAQVVAYACVGLLLVLVATTTLMAVQDRVRQHALLQAIGFSGGRIFALVLVESALLGTLGGALGVAVALAVLHWGRLAIAAEAVSVAFTPTWRLAVAGLAVSLASSLLAGIAPAWQAARADIVAALRES